jgi:uncharacterized protein YdhG (YjbR/CyaY superfamily)
VSSDAADHESTAADRVDAMLGSLPDDQRAAMQSLRETIAAAAPGAVEAISYAAPAYRYRGRPLVAYAAAKHHCSFFPMSPSVLEAHRTELAGFTTAKGTIRFGPDRPIPVAVIHAIVRDRIAEIEGARRETTGSDSVG